MFHKDTPAERAQKAKNMEEARAWLPELIGYGYQVHEFKPWHWRISRRPDWKLEVDVWPTTKKMQNKDTGHTFLYKDLFETIDRIFTSDEYMP